MNSRNPVYVYPANDFKARVAIERKQKNISIKKYACQNFECCQSTNNGITVTDETKVSAIMYFKIKAEATASVTFNGAELHTNQ